MSKVAFISDIHGNLPALKAVLKDIEELGVDDIYCLGDLVGYYSQINEVIDEIKTRQIKCIMGNHDYAMAYNKGVIDRSKTCTNVLTKQLTYIKKENFDFLKSLPYSLDLCIDGFRILCVHGGLNDYVDEYLGEMSDDYFKSISNEFDIMISGHNHLVCVKQFDNILYGNSGSVGQPRDHNSRASYLVFENGSLGIRRVEYDIESTIAKMSEGGFPDYIAEVLRKGYRIGEKDE